MTAILQRLALAGLLALALLPVASAQQHGLIEPPFLEQRVAKGELPPIAERLPRKPLVVHLEDRKREIGRYGGDVRTLVAKPRDLRYLTVNGYTRLVGYDETLALKPDLLEHVENEGDRVFTFTLRDGHRWSDGEPFTTEDFRYFWEDIANNKELSPAGPPDFMIVDGVPAKVEVLDDRHIRYSWDKPNPRFLPALAMPRPTFIYSPAHYLKQFHAKYSDPDKLAKLAAKKKLTSWAALHNKLDDPYEAGNVDMPVLDPWHVVTKAPAQRFIFERNPFYHRVDEAGHQLPYVDRIVVDVASAGLFAAKANAGEVDLLVRGLTTNDVPVLKQGEATHDYKTLLWPVARGSAFALYPNQNTNDPVWQALMRDVRVRRALSLGIDRHTLNNALWFGLGQEGNNTVRPESALYEERDRTAWAHYDVDRANALLDEIGLTKKDGAGIRLLSDGRPMELLVEVDGESGELIDALQITTEFWADLGIKLLVKPQEASNLRQRSFAGQTLMVAAQGLDNALPTALMPPSELAPIRQDNPAWPQWGQYYETAGKAGSKPDGPGMDELMRLYEEWLHSSDLTAKSRIWADLLRLNAENQYTIGTVAGSIQPLVVSKHLRNVPTQAIYSWEPTAMLGAYRVDEFFYDNQPASGPSQ